LLKIKKKCYFATKQMINIHTMQLISLYTPEALFFAVEITVVAAAGGGAVATI